MEQKVNVLPLEEYAKEVEVAINTATLAKLFSCGSLCAADLHCLNASSKQVLWQICRSTCLKSR